VIGSPRNLRHRTTVPASKSSMSSRQALAWTPSGESMASPRGKNKGVKKLRKILGNKKGIQTILAALLMVVIVVVASVMVYAWSTGLLGSLLVHPTTGNEAISMEQASFNSNNFNVTLYLRNTGAAAISFTTYYVKDSTGSTYTQSAYSWGPTIQPTQVGLANIGINTACGCGSASGNAYQFVASNAYTILLISSRGNQFSLTVTR
jgi:hypothetical protein